MREVKIEAWCDRCWHEHEQRTMSVGEWTLAVVQGDNPHPTPKVLDFCEPHMLEVKMLAELVAESAILPTKVKPVPTTAPTNYATPARIRKVVCPVCKTHQNRASLVAHVWVSHRTDIRPEIPRDCVDCGAHYDSSQGIATHRRLAHDFDALTDALAGVKGYKITGRERDL